MRYLVTGASGQLGREFVELLDARGHEVLGLGRSELDVTDRRQVVDMISAVAPDVVIHAAAMTAVDACESEADAAFLANAVAPRWVAAAAADVGARVVLFSTDYVFSGELDRPYTEWDSTDPRSIYGLSKRGGEQAAGPGDLVVRTSWLCGQYGSNIVKTVLGLAEAGTEMAFVTDQVGNPSFASDVALATLELVEHEVTGIAHLTNQGSASWYEFVREILSRSGHEPELVRPIITSELDPPRAAIRPKNSRLDNLVPRLHGLEATQPWRDGLTALLASLDG